MLALLSASRLLVWRCCHVDACSLRIVFTEKMPAVAKKAICMPETVPHDTAWKVLAEREIHRFMSPNGPFLSRRIDK
jgi:hypothetical protein